MCSWWSSASRIRSTAACMFGSRNGSLNDFKRGCRKRSTSSAVAKPLRINSRAMQGEPHISAHENGPPFSSSGDAMIHRLCTDQLIRGELPDKMQCSRSRFGSDHSLLANTREQLWRYHESHASFSYE